VTDLPERFVDITFTLGAGTFAESGTDTVTLSGHRCQVRIQKAGGAAKNLSQIAVWGVSLSIMNRLSTLGIVIQALPRNTVTVQARTGAAGKPTQVFKGQIIAAATDFQGSPDVPFRVEAQAGAYEAVAPAAASSFQGTVPISQIMQQIANAMGVGFENNLTQDVMLTNQNLPGTAWEQMRAAAVAADIGANVDDGVLTIYDKNGPRTGTPVPLSPGTGMVGYPTYISQGLKARTLYNPAIRFRGQVALSGSIVKQANGTWLIMGVDHRLDSLLPNGEWFSDLYLYSANPATPPPIVP
jgi:baseplate hub protein gp41